MRRLLALSLAALGLATVDTLWTRADQWHRPNEWALPLQTFGLWLGFVLLAWPVAALARSLARRFSRGDADGERPWCRDAIVLAGFAALPVVAHSRLDPYTKIFGDVSALRTARPWLEVAGFALLLVVGLLVLDRVLARLRPAVGALAVVGVCLLSLVVLPLREDRFPPATEDAVGQPNLLLLIWDTTRAQNLEAYGYDRETSPHLAELAERSVLFEEARSVAVYTLTSHITMLTGAYPSHHGARLTRMRLDSRRTPSIARILRDRGYRTGAFVGTGVLRAGTNVVDGFEVYDDLVDPAVCDTRAWGLVHDVQSVLAKVAPDVFNRHGDMHWIQDFQRPADTSLENAAKWIESDDPRPWFCMINMYDVHWPYLPETESRERWVEDYDGPITGHLFRHDDYRHRDNGGVHGSLLVDEDNAHLEDLYDAEMFELDRKVAAFLERIGAEDGGTGIVISSDHGEAFGEGGRYEHADILEPQVRIPLIVHPPAGHPGRELVGRTLSGKVSGVDIAPTLLSMAGLDQGQRILALNPILEEQAENMGECEHADFDCGHVLTLGRDVLGEFDREERPILVEDRDLPQPERIRIAIYRDHWKFVRVGIGDAARIELFDLRTDAIGLTNVAAEHPEVCAALEAELDRLRKRWGANDALDATQAEYTHSDMLEGLGYTETRGGESQ